MSFQRCPSCGGLGTTHRFNDLGVVEYPITCTKCGGRGKVVA